MTKFQDKKFSVAVGGDAYRDGWDRAFGPDVRAKAAESKEQSTESRLQAYQAWALTKWGIPATDPLERHLCNAVLGLVGESQEVLKLCFTDLPDDEFATEKCNELGDCLYYLTVLANFWGVEFVPTLATVLDDAAYDEYNAGAFEDLGQNAAVIAESIKKQCFGHKPHEINIRRTLFDTYVYGFVSCCKSAAEFWTILDGNVKKLNTRHPTGFKKPNAGLTAAATKFAALETETDTVLQVPSDDTIMWDGKMVKEDMQVVVPLWALTEAASYTPLADTKASKKLLSILKKCVDDAVEALTPGKP